jgi:hypothetical protein
MWGHLSDDKELAQDTPTMNPDHSGVNDIIMAICNRGYMYSPVLNKKLRFS